MIFAIVAAGVLGAIIGSFLNVVIYRVPAKKSIVTPASACGSCGAPIRARDNIPVLSWLMLRGRCRDCSARISVRYPAVELGTALAFAGTVAWTIDAFAAAGTIAVVLVSLGYLYLAAISIALAVIDAQTHTLPNVIVLPAYPVAAALLTAAAVALGEPARLFTVAAAGAVRFGLYLLLARIRPGGMGMGDVKLAGVLGCYLGFLGWGALFVGAFAAFLLGGVFGVLLLALRRVGRGGSIPFGPWMLAGAWIGIVAGDALATGYLGLFGLSGIR